MKKEKYILLFYVFSFITFLTSVFYSVYISLAFETVLLLYALFYVMNIYKGKMRKPIMAYLFLIVISLLAYIVFFKDANMLISLLNLAIIPVFVFTYHNDKGLVKFKVMELFKILSIILSVLFIFTKDARVCFTLVAVFPFLFMDRQLTRKEIVIESATLFLVLLSKFPLVVYPALFYMIIITIYRFINKNKKAALVTGIMCLITIIYIPIFKVYGLGIYNSDVFGDEVVILKVLKLVIACLPFIYIGIKTISNFIKYEFRINYEMLINLLSVAGFIFLSTHLRLDYTQFIVLVGTLALFNFNKFMDNPKKINDKKVTIMALHLGYGGIEKYLSSLVKMLDGFKIDIISTYKVVDKPAFDYKDSKITYLMEYGPNKDKFNEAIENLNLFKIIPEGIKAAFTLVNKKSYNLEAIREIDSKYVITTREFHNAYVGYYLDKRFIKIATEHNYHNNDEKYINTLVESVEKSNYLVVVSPDLEEFYKKKVVKSCKVVFIPNVLDKSSKSKAKYGTHRIINVGRLSSEKGQDDLVDVVEIIKKDYPDVHLDLVGDGPLSKDLKKYINSKKLSKNVTIHGFKNTDEIEKISLEASVFATTSHTESFGLAVIEAQNYSLPVVAFDTPNGVKYLLKNGSGILVKNRDKKAMAKEIEKLFEDKSLYKKYSDESKKNANNYLLENVKPLWENIIK